MRTRLASTAALAGAEDAAARAVGEARAAPRPRGARKGARVRAPRAAHAEDALAGELEIREVVVRVEERHGVSAAARGAGGSWLSRAFARALCGVVGRCAQVGSGGAQHAGTLQPLAARASALAQLPLGQAGGGV
jgi:hypothetical protein